jgi:hypothetical protein
MADKIFKKYYSRVAKESFLKSLLIGLLIGVAVFLVTTIALWLAEVKAGLWIALVAFVVVSAAATPILYFAKFRPTTKSIAKRVDALGLEERLITMQELENDDSYIAMRQREDAMKALNTVNSMMIKVAVSVSLVVALAITSVFGVGMLSVSALYYNDKIPSLKGLLTGEDANAETTYSLYYKVGTANAGVILDWETGEEYPEYVTEEGSELKTKNIYKVTAGESGPMVYAEAADGWTFVGWSDGVTTMFRQDINVTADVEVAALFEKIDEEEAEEELTDPDIGTISDNTDGEPSNESGTPSDEDSMPPDPNDSDGEKNNSDADGDGDGDGAGAGRDEATNQVVDGDTFYGDTNYESEGTESLKGNDEVPDHLKNGVGDYYGAIQP